jgi:hypothetical protein
MVIKDKRQQIAGVCLLHWPHATRLQSPGASTKPVLLGCDTCKTSELKLIRVLCKHRKNMPTSPFRRLGSNCPGSCKKLTVLSKTSQRAGSNHL